MTYDISDHEECSQCGVEIEVDNKKYIKYLETLEILFATVSAGDEALISTDDESISHIFITTLSEKCISIAYNPEKTIADVKKVIEKELETPCAKQCLLYNDTELKVCLYSCYSLPYCLSKTLLSKQNCHSCFV